MSLSHFRNKRYDVKPAEDTIDARYRVQQLIEAGWTIEVCTLTRDGERAEVNADGDVSVLDD